MKAQTRATLGGLAWLAFTAAMVRSLRGETWAEALLAFAALVLVPLALELLREEGEPSWSGSWFALAAQVQLPAALLLTAAFALPRGPLAGALAAPWCAFTLLLAGIGLRRLGAGGIGRELHGLCADAALLFLAVGGAWAVADRVGFRPLGFDFGIVVLTAVHFHYAGFLLPLFAGLVQRERWLSRLAARAAVGVVLGVPALALGITGTQLGWGPHLETAAGGGLAVAGAGVAILQVRIALEAARPAPARALLAISGVALFFAMVLAALYAIRPFAAPVPWLALPQMRMLHGTANALGFAFCGVLGWRLARDAGRPGPAV